MRARENAKSALTVSAQTVARVLGLTVRRIQQLTQDGVLQTQPEGKRRVYDLPAAVQAYLQYSISREAGKDAGAAAVERRRALAEAEIKEAKAEIATIELKELMGKMHRSEDVEALTTDMIYSIRAMLLAMPGRLAVDLAAATKPTEVSDKIKGEVYNVLAQITNYEYDPDAYRERVRQREGWEGHAAEEEDARDGD